MTIHMLNFKGYGSACSRKKGAAADILPEDEFRKVPVENRCQACLLIMRHQAAYKAFKKV